MTILEMHSWFDILQAKGLNIEFTSREKDHILNRAQIKYVNEVLQTKYLPSIQADEKSKIVFSPTESTIAGEKTLSPLILTDIDVGSASSTGHMSFNWIASKIDEWLAGNLSWYPSTYTGSKVLAILGIDMWESPAGVNLNPRRPLRYMENYMQRKSYLNVFRTPKAHSPIYYIRNNAVQTAPFSDTHGGKFFFTVIKEPRAVLMANDIDDRVDCELPDFTHDEIMAIALDDAGVATRDQTLIQLNQANKGNLTESA